MATLEEQLALAQASIASMQQSFVDMEKQVIVLSEYQNNITANTTPPTIMVAQNTDAFYVFAADGIIDASNANGGIIFPTGTTDQRPPLSANGTVRYNSTTGALEIFSGVWQNVGTGSSGSGGGGGSNLPINDNFYVNSNTITVGFTTLPGKNYSSFGPLLHTTGVIKVIEGSLWKVY